MANMPSNTTNTRESRRRKILDRGTDRLSLITGRIQALPSESSDNPKEDPSQPLTCHLSVQTTVSSNGNDGAFDSKLPNSVPTTIDSGHGGSRVEPPPLPECGASVEASRAAPSDVTSNVQSSLASSTDEKSTMLTSGAGRHLESQTCQNRFVTPNEISSAIVASEKSRLFCSVTIALLVVLSYLGFPLLGSNILKSIISFSPLYLVLLTNLTLVLSRLLFNNQRGLERPGRAEFNIPSTDRYDWAAQAGKAMEVGLVMQKAIDAVFMDCSVYTMIIICGLSFV